MKVSVITFLLQFALLAASLPAVDLTAPDSSIDTIPPKIRNNSTGSIQLTGTLNSPDGNVMANTILYYKCETTEASPRTYNTEEAARRLKEDLPPNQWCLVLNSSGSRCSTMVVTNDAQLGICGQYGWGISCSEAANAALLIVKYCEWFGLAGGQIRFDFPLDARVIVY